MASQAGLFQGRWYHYYERGLSFAEGAFLAGGRA